MEYSQKRFSESDIHMMKEALKLAEEAALAGEVPVGAVVAKNRQIIGRGRNRVEELKDPLAHAEMIAMKEALNAKKGFRLTDCKMYVTLEPCAMCAGAMVHCRISDIFIGTPDPKSGACGTVMNILEHPALNHHPNVVTGLLLEECRNLLKNFFARLRMEQRRKKIKNHSVVVESKLKN